jgi:CO dehydrogenase nickel-insertion accessory protein CooC1
MACIHLVDGDKGGVGKSFVCSTLLQYFLDHNINFTPVEADRYNPDVANRYGELDLPVRHFQRRRTPDPGRSTAGLSREAAADHLIAIPSGTAPEHLARYGPL